MADPKDVGHGFTMLKVERGRYDVVDWPQPGSWAGRVEHRRRWNGGAHRWFLSRADIGKVDLVGERDGYPTLREAAAALVALRETETCEDICMDECQGPCHGA